jgi:glutamate synthase (NADPH/NADH) small chain
MELGDPDASGRRSPVEVPGKTETIEVDEVIISVGVSPNPLIPQSVIGLEVTKWGTIVVNNDTMQTEIPMIFAGGDIVRGGATVILAMGDGRKVALQIKKNFVIILKKGVSNSLRNAFFVTLKYKFTFKW